MDNSKILTNALDELEIAYDNDKIFKLLSYYEMLIEKNKVMNLTSITDYKEVMIKHFADSLSILKYLEPIENEYVLDIGTGAGLPGIPPSRVLKARLPSPGHPRLPQAGTEADPGTSSEAAEAPPSPPRCGRRKTLRSPGARCPTGPRWTRPRPPGSARGSRG